MTDRKDDKILEEYLKGDSELSRRYQTGKVMEPPGHLNAAIIKAAHSAVAASARPKSRSWYVPLSLAAVLVIGVSLVFRMYEDQGMELLSEPAPDLMLELKSDSDTNKDSAEDKPAAQEIVPTPMPVPVIPAQPAPQTHQMEQEKAHQLQELQQKEMNEAATRQSAEIPAPAESFSQSKNEQPLLHEEAPMPSGMQVELDTGPSDEVSSEQLQQTDALYKKMYDAAAPAQESTAKMKSSAQPAAAALAEPAELSGTSFASKRAMSVMSENEWLSQIRQLWEEGRKKEAIASLAQFKLAYPEYPREAITAQLPEDFTE